MMNNIKGQSNTKIISVMIQSRGKILMCIDVQILFSSHQVVRGKQSEQSEDVVTMEMAYENMTDL